MRVGVKSSCIGSIIPLLPLYIHCLEDLRLNNTEQAGNEEELEGRLKV